MGLIRRRASIDDGPQEGQCSADRDQSSLSVQNSEFYLDEGASLEITGSQSSLLFPRWTCVKHCTDKRHALIIISGEEVILNHRSLVSIDDRMFIRFTAGLPEISADGLSMELLFNDTSSEPKEVTIATFNLEGGAQTSLWRQADLDISYLSGRKGNFGIRCLPGPLNDPRGDWLAISDLCIAREDRMPLTKARSFFNLRSRNEIEHFSHVYRHSMYSEKQRSLAESAKGHSRTLKKWRLDDGCGHEGNKDRMRTVNPTPGETPYDYGMRLLAANIPQPSPDFLGHLKKLSEKPGRVRILSLCSGAARIEADFASRAGPSVEWSLLDINPDLLDMASEQFASGLKLDLIEGNVNELMFSDEKWDVIMCVSAMHHIVELERLMEFCFRSLKPEGEFWSLGEYVGRNGNRLWPDAMEEANSIFRELPERYRINRNTKKVDDVMPPNDYSVGCFEGIRSEDIESLLNRWFVPVDVYRRNCFLWRMLNLAYCNNYDLNKDEDREWIVRMVEKELAHFRKGGRPTELFGIYRPRPLDIS